MIKKDKMISVQFSCSPTAVLTYHAAGDTVFSAVLDDGDIVPTLQGDDIVIVIENGMHPVLLFIMLSL